MIYSMFQTEYSHTGRDPNIYAQVEPALPPYFRILSSADSIRVAQYHVIFHRSWPHGLRVEAKTPWRPRSAFPNTTTQDRILHLPSWHEDPLRHAVRDRRGHLY